MGYGKTVNNLKRYLNCDESYQYIQGRGREIILNSVNKMAKDIGIVQEGTDESLQIQGKDVKNIVRSISLLNEKLILEQSSKGFNKFNHDFVLLSSNWNQVVESKDLSKKINVNQKLLEYHTSMVETCRVLKHLLKEIKGMQSFSPPSFDLSRHYLKSIQERFEKSEDKQKA